MKVVKIELPIQKFVCECPPITCRPHRHIGHCLRDLHEKIDQLLNEISHLRNRYQDHRHELTSGGSVGRVDD